VCRREHVLIIQHASTCVARAAGDSLHIEWHDGRLHVEQAVVDHAAGLAEVKVSHASQGTVRCGALSDLQVSATVGNWALQVRPTTDGRGNGAFAAAAIAQGAFLAEYEGELLSEAQYWRRYPSGVVRRGRIAVDALQPFLTHCVAALVIATLPYMALGAHE
jgi:hypothetical protein